MEIFKEQVKLKRKKEKIIRDECFETLQGLSIKELLILNLFKGVGLDEQYYFNKLLIKAKSFKDMNKDGKF